MVLVQQFSYSLYLNELLLISLIGSINFRTLLGNSWTNKQNLHLAFIQYIIDNWRPSQWCLWVLPWVSLSSHHPFPCFLTLSLGRPTIGTFGNGFTSGNSFGSVYISVPGNKETNVIISTFGSFSSEVGFTIKAPNGTTIYQRSAGTSFSATTIFSTFCPIGGCPVSPNITYTLTVTDSYGDGWEGTTLAFKQNGVVTSTFTLSTGSSAVSSVSFAKLQTVSVTVYLLGNYTNEIGFILRNAAGGTVFQKFAGSKFFANTLLGSFCPECMNLNPPSI